MRPTTKFTLHNTEKPYQITIDFPAIEEEGLELDLDTAINRFLNQYRLHGVFALNREASGDDMGATLFETPSQYLHGFGFETALALRLTKLMEGSYPTDFIAFVKGMALHPNSSDTETLVTYYNYLLRANKPVPKILPFERIGYAVDIPGEDLAKLLPELQHFVEVNRMHLHMSVERYKPGSTIINMDFSRRGFAGIWFAFVLSTEGLFLKKSQQIVENHNLKIIVKSTALQIERAFGPCYSFPFPWKECSSFREETFSLY